MTRRRKLHPPNPDQAAAVADTRWVHTVYGKGTPRHFKVAEAKRNELRRIMSNVHEIERLDKLESATLPAMPAYPVVMRARVKG